MSGQSTGLAGAPRGELAREPNGCLPRDNTGMNTSWQTSHRLKRDSAWIPEGLPLTPGERWSARKLPGGVQKCFFAVLAPAVVLVATLGDAGRPIL